MLFSKKPRWDNSRCARALIPAALLIVLAGCGKGGPTSDKNDEQTTQAGVSLTGEQMKSLGIATAPARAGRYRRKLSGYGVVVALDTIAQADADVSTASAAAAQSAAAAVRARVLSAGGEAAVSKEVVEAAESKAAADQAALALARRKSQAAFGLRAPWHTPSQRAAIMGQLGAGRAVLLRITFPLGALAGMKPQKVAISRTGADAATWDSSRLWQAPADPNLPGQGFYCLLEGADLAQGEHVTATVDIGPAKTGVVIPMAAILIGEDDTWAFVEPKDGHFEKVRIDTSRPEADGYFIAADAGIAPGERVVTGSAGLLLARESNPSTDAGD